MSQTPASPEESRPVPPRYWWLKRLGAAYILFLIVLAVMRLIWGQVAERRLQAQLASYRAAGQPVLMEDFTPAPVADADNAAEYLQKAATGLTQSLNPEDVYYGLRHGALGPADAQTFLSAHAAALQLLHQASTKTDVDWHIKLTSPAVSIMLPNLSPQRALAKTGCVALRYQHVRGDDAAALATAGDVLAAARHVDARTPFFIAHLVAVGEEAALVYALEEITPTLQVTDGPATAAAAGRPATRAQVTALAGELLEVTPLKERWTRAMQAERAQQLDTVQWVINAPSGLAALTGTAAAPPAATLGRVFGVLLAPAWKLDLIRQLQRCDAYGRAADAATWPAAQRLAPDDPTSDPPPAGPAVIAHLFSRVLSPSLEGALKQLYTIIALRRLAGTALAIRLYELDHGRRPSALDDLVPAYLSAVPGDPFDPDARPLRYLPEAAVPVLYSVSLNGTDDGGVFGMQGSGYVDWRERDMPFFLDGHRPYPPPYNALAGAAAATQPSTAEALDQDGDVEDGKGNEGKREPQPE